MGQPNRTRRNSRKADQFKTKPRPKNKEKPLEEEALEALIEKRTTAFVKFFDKLEENGITEGDKKIIARAATKDGYMSYSGNQDIADLSDLKVEELTEVEFVTILKRANYALNTILENRVNYIDGPFYKNRHTVHTLMAKVFPAQRPKKSIGSARARKSVSASGMVEAQKRSRQALRAMAK
jgi:hypothetical protein